MDYAIPQEVLIGGGALIVLLVLQFLVVLATSKNYVWNRFRSKLTGREFVELVDVDNKSQYTVMEKQAGELIGRETEHIITPGSVTRNRDGDIYHVNKRAGLTPNALAIEAANRIKAERGYSTFSEALYAYIMDTHKAEYDKLQMLLKDEKDMNVKRKLQKDFDRLIKKDLYEEGRNFTQDLSILYEWTAQPLDAFANRTLVEQKEMEAEKRARSGAMPMEKVFQYVIIGIVALGGLFVVLLLARSTGFNVTGEVSQIITTTTTTTTTLPNLAILP